MEAKVSLGCHNIITKTNFKCFIIHRTRSIAGIVQQQSLSFDRCSNWASKSRRWHFGARSGTSLYVEMVHATLAPHLETFQQ
jgi:hypothetical protein